MIAGDQGRIDGADRYAGHPVEIDIRLGHGLINATLIGAERASALKEERDPFERRPPQADMRLERDGVVSRHRKLS